jgi:TPP-dependent pyruvate/acetoin dehydrogenase alpha subunit
MIDSASQYHQLYRIRLFEETVLDNFPRGVFFGTTHTCLGQEANAVGVLSHLGPMDIVFSNHRGHGHFLAYGGDPHQLFAELMGRSTGVCGGRGGSQHLHYKNFYSNGVQGGILPVATGMALAEKFKNTGAGVVAFMGDGTLGEGALYESVNLARLHQAPILYVVENNRIAQTTPVEIGIAGSIKERFLAFGIPVTELDSSDVQEINAVSGDSFELIRQGKGPRALLLHTQRFGPHSKGDDSRDPEVVARLRLLHDPVKIQAARLAAEVRLEIERQVSQEITQAFEAALADPLAEPNP